MFLTGEGTCGRKRGLQIPPKTVKRRNMYRKSKGASIYKRRVIINNNKNVNELQKDRLTGCEGCRNQIEIEGHRDYTLRCASRYKYNYLQVLLTGRRFVVPTWLHVNNAVSKARGTRLTWRRRWRWSKVQESREGKPIYKNRMVKQCGSSSWRCQMAPQAEITKLLHRHRNRINQARKQKINMKKYKLGRKWKK